MTDAKGLLLRLVVFSIIFMMLGLVGMINIPTASSETTEESSRAESVRADLTPYIKIIDPTYVDDMTFGDDDPGDYYTFYLNSEVSSFSIEMENVFGEGYFRYVNTTLSARSGSSDLLTVTDAEYQRTYMSDGSQRYFYYAFDIGDSGDMNDVYELKLDIVLTVVDDSYVTSYVSGYYYIKIQLSSRILSNYGSGDLELVAMNQYGSYVPLYSGATNQRLTMPNVYSADGYLEDVYFKLSPPSGYIFNSKSTSVDELYTSYYSNDEPIWQLTSAGANEKLPDTDTGSMEVTYDMGSTTITERNIEFSITIAKTPILYLDGQIGESAIGSMQNNEYLRNFQIYQGTTSETFSVTFKNEGNVDLKDIEVEMYTDNAAYFFKSKYYYDESSYASKVSYGKTVTLGDIKVGKTITKEFPTEVIKNLPPGLYKIPIRYDASYTESASLDLDFDEKDYHEEIVEARSTTSEGFLPFLLVEVVEGEDANDQSEPDIQALSNTYLQAGMRNVKLEIELTNLENYRLNTVNVKLAGGGSQPLDKLNEESETELEIEPQEKDFTMYAANNPSYSNKNIITFFIDVSKDTMPGVNYVPLTITCLDPYNQERTNTINVPLNINVPPPRFIISDVTTTNVAPDKSFIVSMKVYNCGGCGADDVFVMFNGSSNLFSAEVAEVGPKSIERGKSETFEFTILASEIDEGQVYQPSFFLSYKDSMGNEYPYSEETEQTVSIRSQIPEPEPESFWDVNMGLALVIFGILILISAIILGFIYFKVSHPDFGTKKAKEPKPPKEPKEKKAKPEKAPAPGPQPQQQQQYSQPTPQPTYEQSPPPPPPPTYQPQQPPQYQYQQQSPPPRPPRQY